MTMTSFQHSPRGPRHRLPKLCGGDLELANFVLGRDSATDTCAEASTALLREIDGIAVASDGPPAAGGGGNPGAVGPDPRDQGRRFLASNGGCIYIDLDHLELCLPEVLSARDHVAAWCALLRIAREAQIVANGRLPDHQRIQVLVNNSDGLGHSYGGHLNVLITRRAWDNLFFRKLHHLLYLAAYQVSSIVFTGQGKVGSENGRPAVEFQLSQRADFMETLTGVQTTAHRPIVNSRDEAHCGGHDHRRDAAEMARLHVIFYDSNLAEVASFLKVGVLQIVLAMVEAEEVDPRMVLDDPLDALHRWSHDPTLTATATTTGGRHLTAVEMQYHFLEAATRFAQGGGLDEIVPEFPEILRLWEETLEMLEERDLTALARRLDWALKYVALQRTLEQHPHLDWGSVEIKHLDQLFASLDPAEGLFWAYDNAGLVERVVAAERIAYLLHNPPEETRAWTRAMVLRQAGAGRVADVGWDRIRLRDGRGGVGTVYRTLHLPDPLGLHKGEVEAAFRGTPSVDEILDRLGVAERDVRPTTKLTPLLRRSTGGRGGYRW